MSHVTERGTLKVSDEPFSSQLSADAACFVPNNFGSNAVHTVPSFDGNAYVWGNMDISGTTSFLRHAGPWNYGFESTRMPDAFHFNQYPAVDMNYWSMASGENTKNHPSPYIHDAFGGSGTCNVSQSDRQSRPVTAQAQLVTAESRMPSKTVTEQAGAASSLTDSSRVLESKRPKRRKKKKLIIEDTQLHQESSAAAVMETVSVKQLTATPIQIREPHEAGTGSLPISSHVLEIRVQDQALPIGLRENGSQTDFSEELSKLTLSEKPNSLYSRSSSCDLFMECAVTSSSGPSLSNVCNAVSKPLLWSNIVSKNSACLGVEPGGHSKKPKETNDGISNIGEKKPLKHENKSKFDHSATRSQSGKRKSTGISTNDKCRDFLSKDKIKSSRSTKSSNVEAITNKLNCQEIINKNKNQSSKTSKVEHSSDKITLKGSHVNVKNEGSSSARPEKEAARNKQSETSKFPSGSSRTIGSLSENLNFHPSGKSRLESGGRKIESSHTSDAHLKETSNNDLQTATTRSGSREKGNGRSMGFVPILPPYSESQTEDGNKTKRKHRNRKKKTTGQDGGQTVIDKLNNEATATKNSLSLQRREVLPPCNNEDEFPTLLVVKHESPIVVSSGPIKYSDILSGSAKSQSQSYIKFLQTSEDIKIKDGIEKDSDDDDTTAESVVLEMKRSSSQPARRARSKPAKKSGAAVAKKSAEPIMLNIFDLIVSKNKKSETKVDKKYKKSVIEEDEDAKQRKRSVKKLHKSLESRRGNILDSSAVNMRRGKEREVPKQKKPSSLRKVILKERESRRQKFLQECLQNGATLVTEVNGEDSPVQSETSEGIVHDGSLVPCDASNLRHRSLSPGRSLPSPCLPQAQDQEDDANTVQNSHNTVLLSMVHSRRFREYCNQVLSKEIDGCCEQLLHELVRFQDRLYQKDPNKAKLKRRFVLGLREVVKHLQLQKLRCVIISPNLERVQSKGGLDEVLHNIISLCQQQNVPFVFALSRKKLGKACSKVVPVSVVGIFSYEGAEEHFHKLKELTEVARKSYQEMLNSLEKELAELELSNCNKKSEANAENSASNNGQENGRTEQCSDSISTDNYTSCAADHSLPVILNAEAEEFVFTGSLYLEESLLEDCFSEDEVRALSERLSYFSTLMTQPVTSCDGSLVELQHTTDPNEDVLSASGIDLNFVWQ